METEEERGRAKKRGDDRRKMKLLDLRFREGEENGRVEESVKRMLRIVRLSNGYK